MKRLLIILLLFVIGLIFNQNANAGIWYMDSVRVDTTEYELEVFDPGYESYLVMKPSKEFYSKQYYENWNKRYVREWNYFYSTGRYPHLIETYIDYDPFTDYGLELNYKLYHYFKFWEKKNGLKLLPESR